MVQMPAMNTTQFGFVKSYLPNKPKPMGTIYQPEDAAEAVLYAAKHNEREVFYGYPTYKTIIGNKVVPGYLDKYLGETGYEGQQTKEAKDPGRQNNLWESIPGDHGAHWPFIKNTTHVSPILFAHKTKWAMAPVITEFILGATCLTNTV